jgi:hypothetical protein
MAKRYPAASAGMMIGIPLYVIALTRIASEEEREKMQM